MPAVACRHCRRAKVNRPRGLCWTCYYTPGVVALYPSTSKYARRGVGHGHRVHAPLPEPTDALPGTPEKLAVLAARSAAGQQLHHPADPVVTPVPVGVPGLHTSRPLRPIVDRRGRGATFYENDTRG